jgi:hypothetical protein
VYGAAVTRALRSGIVRNDEKKRRSRERRRALVNERATRGDSEVTFSLHSQPSLSNNVLGTILERHIDIQRLHQLNLRVRPCLKIALTFAI